MSLHHARPGELIDIRPLGEALRATPSQALVRSDQIEVLRLVLQAGENHPDHDVSASAITLQCLEGQVALHAYGVTQTLSTGSLVFLAAGVPHRVSAITDASLLMTLCLDRSTADPAQADAI